MLFSSIPFLYVFLPVVLALYALAPRRAKNYWLLAASLFFYFWGEPVYVLLMIFSALSGWIFGFAIDKHRGTAKSKAAMIASVVVGIGLLGLFKYSDFFLENVNRLLGRDPATGLLGLTLPIGISFYTFQILSYTIDLYRGEARLQRNFFSLATYISFFPQLIAGPIVRYTTIAQELEHRRHSLADVSAGITQFVVGLGKKVLIANVMGQLCELYKSGEEKTVLFTWLYIAAFAFQIYFDFSGYSDMAIGLGRIFGFHFLENFNYPYIARSVTDFWRRWHMSLGSWFRDYVYIPLGGNRVGAARHVFNILVVWFLTGFWHGAGWTFIAWGLFFGVLLLLEKHLLGPLLAKLPKAVGHIYLLLAVLVGWVLFDAASIPVALDRLKMMIGVGAQGLWGGQSLYYLRSYLIPLMLAAVGSTPLLRKAVDWIASRKNGEKILTVAEPLAVGALLLVVTAYLIDGSFNPFIYFRF